MGREVQEGGLMGVPMADSCCLTEKKKICKAINLKLKNNKVAKKKKKKNLPAIQKTWV